MENNKKTKINIVELAILLTLSIHHISIMIVSLYRNWPSWYPVLTVVLVVMNWVIVVGNFQTPKVRSFFTSIFMNISLVIYAYFNRNLYEILIPLCTITVILSMYDEVIAIFPQLATVVWVTVLQIITMVKTPTEGTRVETALLFPVVNTLTICGFIIYWIYRRKQNHTTLLNTIDEMQKAQDYKDDFLANVSHEIRTPINTVDGLSQMLLEAENPEEMREDLYRIRSAGKRLTFVVSDILDFSELERGMITLEEEQYSVADTIAEIVNMSIAQEREGKHLELIVNYPADLPRVLIGDEKKIRRAVMNAVGNAFKFTEEGCVVIDFSAREEQYGVNLMITVRDTGVGMKAEDLDRLFSTYNQADTSRSRSEEGLGLGLAISRAIIQQMGGTISVFSDYEKGTEIRFVIPQKVFDSKPMIVVHDPDGIYACIYMNMEQFSVAMTRDEYMRALNLMREQLHVNSMYCRNLAELKRRVSENKFTHIFISISEYYEDSEYFDQLSERLVLMVVADRQNQVAIKNPRVIINYKPFQMMPIAQILNGKYKKKNYSFKAPEVTALIVDDNEMNIRVAQGQLKRFEMKTKSALSGAEALEILSQEHFDLIFLDHMMPGMDGVETLHRIRAMSGRYFTTVPVIALTANAVAGARDMLLSEGFDEFLAKPIERSVLERILDRLLPDTKKVRDQEKESAEEAQNSEEPEEPEEKPALSETTGNYTFESLNREQGELYCGGPECWEDILRVYAEKKDKNYLPLQELFDRKDWKNYTITIHGIKSSMKSVGAEALSEQARLLEMAGREDNIAYIEQNHAHVYEMYKALVQNLMQHFGIEEDAEESAGEAAETFPEFSEEEMEQCCNELEDAMFKLDGDAMKAIVERARNHSYHGASMNPTVDAVEQKIKMADYMSAADTFSKLR